MDEETLIEAVGDDVKENAVLTLEDTDGVAE